MLYIVGTPIGNMKDITLRAIETLREVDLILCEDTRVTGKLLKHFEIEKKTMSFHEHSDAAKYEKILDILEEGKSIALVTDAGTPAISDPGSFLIKTVRQKLPEVKISPIPGPSALATLLSVSGSQAHSFTFMGFPPHKKGRKTFFEKVTGSEIPIVFYESTHRLEKALNSLAENCPEKIVTVGKELTKMFEEVIIGTPSEVLEYFAANPEKKKGEFVVLVE